jgi:hypothetical protein
MLLVAPLTAQQLSETNWGKNTPGVELGTHEDPRQHNASGTLLTYNIIGRGFPAGIPYALWGWSLGKQPQKLMEGVSFDRRGLVICSGKPGFCSGQVADDAVNVRATARAGEPKRFAVVSSDGKIAAFAEAVPFPITASDKGCKLSIVREDPLAEVVLVRGSGFAANEALTLTGQFAGAPRVTAAADGTWEARITTKVQGQKSGVATVKVSGRSCAPSVSFPWGEDGSKPQ